MLDAAGDPLDIERRGRVQAVADEDLGAIDVVGRERGVRGAPRQSQQVAGLVDHVAAVLVARADAAQVADVVDQRRGREMQPVVGGHPLDQDPALEDRLADHGHEDGVVGVVVERIGVRDPLDADVGHGAQKVSELRARVAEDPRVVGGEPLAKLDREHACDVHPGDPRYRIHDRHLAPFARR